MMWAEVIIRCRECRHRAKVVSTSMCVHYAEGLSCVCEGRYAPYSNKIYHAPLLLPTYPMPTLPSKKICARRFD